MPGRICGGGEPPSAPRVEEALQDKTGKVWAITSARNELESFDGEQWKAVSVPFPAGTSARPLELALCADASVVCVWRLREGALAVTRHLGTETSILVPQIDADIAKFRVTPAAFADSHDRLWIMAGDRQVFRVDADGKAELAYQITEADRIPGLRSANKMNPLVAAEDGLGRVWIWTRQDASNFDSMKGVLICEGSTVRKQETFSGLEGGVFTDIARKDRKTMWAATPGGLFTVDIEQFKATSVEMPREAIHRISRLHRQESDLYAVAYGEQRRCLWRLRAAKWTKLVDFFESDQRARIWLPAGKGLVVCLTGIPWYLPEKGEAVRLDWQNGFPLTRVTTMLRLKDGRYLIGNGSTVVCEKIKLPPTPAAESRITELPAQEGLVIDANGHVWYQPRDKRGTLAEWDGAAWHEHDLPASIAQPSNIDCAADEQGRLWVIPRSDESPAAYLDLSTRKWSEFPKIAAAFESVIDTPPRFIESLIWPPRSGAFRPVYHGRQIAFLSGYPRLIYFDGEKWRRWAARETLTPPRSGLRSPSFDEKGNLQVRVAGALARWNGTSFEEVPNAPAAETSDLRQNLTLPDNSVARNFTAVEDNHGTFWYLRDAKLWRSVRDASAPVFAEKEVNPFTTSRMLNLAYVDAGGMAFVGTEAGTMRYFMIKPAHSPPSSTVAVEAVGSDAIKAKVKIKAGGKTVTRWQLDDEPWRVLRGEALELDFLPAGPHILRVTVLDGELQSQGKPTEAAFTISVEPREQLGRLVGALSDRDFAKREAAVAAFRRQPVDAARALREARGVADEDQRWWIDAALQEIGSAPSGK